MFYKIYFVYFLQQNLYLFDIVITFGPSLPLHFPKGEDCYLWIIILFNQFTGLINDSQMALIKQKWSVSSK